MCDLCLMVACAAWKGVRAMDQGEQNGSFWLRKDFKVKVALGMEKCGVKRFPGN